MPECRTRSFPLRPKV